MACLVFGAVQESCYCLGAKNPHPPVPGRGPEAKKKCLRRKIGSFHRFHLSNA